MRSGSKRLMSLVALAAVSVLVVSGCSKSGGNGGGSAPKQYSPGFAECQTKIDECNSGPTKKGGTLVVALGKTIPGFNIASGQNNLVEAVEVVNGIQVGPFVFLPSGKIQATDLVAEEPKIIKTDPQTIQYKINPAAMWEDGSPVTDEDFRLAWLLQNNHDKTINVAGTTGYDQVESVVGSDSGRTVTVTFKSPYADWKGLFTPIPAHIIKKLGGGEITDDKVLEKGFEAFGPDFSWTNGPYKVESWDKEKNVVLVPNPKWYGKTKPALDKVIFQFVVDSAQLIPAIQNKEVNVFVVQPNQAMVTKLQGLTGAGVGYEISSGYSYEHIDVNTGNKFLSDLALRQAIFAGIGVEEIMSKTIKPFFPAVKQMGDHMLYPVESGYKDIRAEVAPDQGTGDPDKAKKYLTDAGYKIEGTKLTTPKGEVVPPLRFRFTKGNAARAAAAEIIQNQLAKIGVTIKIDQTEDLSGTIDAKDFDLIIFGWAGSALHSGNVDIFKSDGGNNDTNFKNSEIDDLLVKAAKELDEKKANDLYLDADRIWTKNAVTLAMWAKPNLLAASSDYVNLRDNGSGSYFSYNCQEWGAKAA